PLPVAPPLAPFGDVDSREGADCPAQADHLVAPPRCGKPGGESRVNFRSERAQLLRLRRIRTQEAPGHPARSQRGAPGPHHASPAYGGELETPATEAGDHT